MTRATLSPLSRPLFHTLDAEMWLRQVRHARSQPNAVSAQIREKLSRDLPCANSVTGAEQHPTTLRKNKPGRAIVGMRGHRLTSEPLSPAQGGPNHAQLNNQQSSAIALRVAETLGAGISKT